MIADQLRLFPRHEHLVDALLGLLSICGDFVEVLERERNDATSCNDDLAVDFALGVVSLTRTLRATLSTAKDASSRDTSIVEPAASLRADTGGLLR